MNQDIFRKVSLDRLSSPEELDQLITVTRSRGWIALFGLIGILMTAVIWSFTGSIPIQVNGAGIITASQGVVNVIAPASGKISDIRIKSGVYVRKGDILARIEQNDLVESINSLKADIDLAQNFSTESFYQEGTPLSSNLKGLYDIAMQIKQVGTTVPEGENLNIPYLKEQLEITRALIVSELTQTYHRAVKELEASSVILSGVDGRILEVRMEKGNIIQVGVSVASIIREDQTVNSQEVVFYVSPEEGKKIAAGMDVHISPTIVKKEDYGYMLGKVVSVSDYPISVQSLVQTLGNQELAYSFSGGSALVEVRIHLIPDSATYSGIRWSTSKGPNIKIESGTICTGAIITKTRRPVEMVIPSLSRE